jgi:hypothetical protein
MLKGLKRTKKALKETVNRIKIGLQQAEFFQA